MKHVVIVKVVAVEIAFVGHLQELMMTREDQHQRKETMGIKRIALLSQEIDPVKEKEIKDTKVAVM